MPTVCKTCMLVSGVMEGDKLKPAIVIVYSSIIIKLKHNDDTSEKIVPVEVEICECRGYCYCILLLY